MLFLRNLALGFLVLLLGVDSSVAQTTAWIEAESVPRFGAFQVYADGSASGGQYLGTPESAGNLYTFGTATRAEFSFTIANAGDYVVEGQTWSPDGASDSFWARVDGAPAAGILWDTAPSGSFVTDEVSERGGADPVVFALAAGSHSVTIYLREAGTRLDRLRLVQVGAPPPSPDPQVTGQWGPVIAWPQVAVSAANLPDGRILTWSGSERRTWPTTEQTYSSTWDPETGAFFEVFHDSHNMFCAHLAMMADGQVFVNGGRNQQNMLCVGWSISMNWPVVASQVAL